MGLQLLNNMDLFLCNFNLYLVCYYPKLFSICMLFLETFWKQPLWAPNMSFWKSFLPVSLQTQESLQVSKISQSYFVSNQKRLIRISLEPCFCNSNFCARHINGFGVHIVDFFFFFSLMLWIRITGVQCHTVFGKRAMVLCLYLPHWSDHWIFGYVRHRSETTKWTGI